MSIQTKTMTVKSDTSLAETTTTIRDTVTFDVSNMPNGITYKGLKAVLSFAEPIQWNKASTYDALTVVWDDASHGSYASKRPVPANIELTNEFYWLRTADLDAQVEMYRQEVSSLSAGLNAEIERAKASERLLSTNVSTLANTVDSFKTVTPEMFGAIGDGSADDSDAVIKAFESGKHVILSGYYKCARNIVINNADKLTIEGKNIIKSGLHFTEGASLTIEGTNTNELRTFNFSISGDGTQSILCTIRNITNVYMQSVNFAESKDYLLDLQDCGIIFFNECIFAGSNKKDVWFPCNGIKVDNSFPIYVTNSNIWNLNIFIKANGIVRGIIVDYNWIEFVGTLVDWTNVRINGSIVSCCKNHYFYTLHGNVDLSNYSTVVIKDITNLFNCNVWIKENLFYLDTANHIKSFVDIANVDQPVNVTFEDNVTFTPLDSLNMYACTVDSNNLNLAYRTPVSRDIKRGCENNILYTYQESFSQTGIRNLNVQVPDNADERIYTEGSIIRKDWVYVKDKESFKPVAISRGDKISRLQENAQLSDVVSKVNALINQLVRTRIIGLNE